MIKSSPTPPPWEESATVDTKWLLRHLQTILDETGHLDHVTLPQEVNPLELSLAAVQNNFTLASAILDLPQEPHTSDTKSS